MGSSGMMSGCGHSMLVNAVKYSVTRGSTQGFLLSHSLLVDFAVHDNHHNPWYPEWHGWAYQSEGSIHNKDAHLIDNTTSGIQLSLPFSSNIFSSYAKEWSFGGRNKMPETMSFQFRSNRFSTCSSSKALSSILLVLL